MRFQVELHLRSWRMWMILESRLVHTRILSPAGKARQALRILRKLTVYNYSIKESASGIRRKNER